MICSSMDLLRFIIHLLKLDKDPNFRSVGIQVASIQAAV